MSFGPDGWTENDGNVYRCPVYLLPDADGGFSVIAATLPGAVSHGQTREKALANIREALTAVIYVYRALGKPIPWVKMPDEPEPGASLHSVFVCVEVKK